MTQTKVSGRYCGNTDCGVSTGICGSLTFGSGYLDDHGYWEHPCVICAAVSQKFTPKYTVWPSPEENAIPVWAGQATPGAQLTVLRGAIAGHLSNLQEGIISPERAVENIEKLLNEQMKQLEEHLRFRPWGQ